MPIAPEIFQNGYTILKRCKHGFFLFNRNDNFIGRSLDLYGEWCEREVTTLAQLIRPGDFVVDIGANIGTHTVALANLVGAVNVSGHQEGEPVEVITVDSIGLPACRLIKIDCEGMEPEVLKGARETIIRTRPFIFVEATLENTRDVIRILTRFGTIAAGTSRAISIPTISFKTQTTFSARTIPKAISCAFRTRRMLLPPDSRKSRGRTITGNSLWNGSSEIGRREDERTSCRFA